MRKYLLKKETVTITIILYFLAQNILAQSDKARQIDSLMNWTNSIGIFNGNILVSKNDKIIYNSSWGYTNASRTEKLTSAFRFNIGSISKEFSAASIISLQEKGKLDLDDKISKFVPELPKWANEISIKNILQYTSGLPDINWDKVKSTEDLLNNLKQLDTLLFKPGTNYKYSNNNFFLQQVIVERIAKIPYNDYLKLFLFKPCKINRAVVNPTNSMPNIAKSFDDRLVDAPLNLPISGVVYATTDDMLKWSKCLIKNKVIGKKSVFQIGQRFDLPNAQSGLGITAFSNNELIAFQHDGSAFNYRALLFSDLKDNVTIILLENNGNEKIFEIADAIKAILKSQKYNLPKKSFFTQFRSQLDNLSLDEFIDFYNRIRTSQSNIYDVESEVTLNSIGYYLISLNRLDDAIKIFKLNIDLFPDSFNVYDSMGEAYSNKGDYKSAILNYKKSLELNQNNYNAKQMIENIMTNNPSY